MPADQVVLTVNASIAIQKNSSSNNPSGIELLFDSAMQALPPGARTSVVSGRQLLYRIGSVYVDMEVDKSADSDRASLVGQMLDSSRPGHPLAGVPVALFERRRNIARTLSNDNGEFHFEFGVEKDLQVCVSIDSKRRVRLPIVLRVQRADPRVQQKRRKACAGVGPVVMS